jgi:cobalamin biosynthesis Mg chelatase CobN
VSRDQTVKKGIESNNASAVNVIRDHEGERTPNTQEMSLTTPVRFEGRCPRTFIRELEARQRRHGWEQKKLLRFAESCLRGEAALWWECCSRADGKEKYATFKAAFETHYGISAVRVLASQEQERDMKSKNNATSSTSRAQASEEGVHANQEQERDMKSNNNATSEHQPGPNKRGREAERRARRR